MILISGPYRSGSGNDPKNMTANLQRLEEVCWPLFKAGHVPMIGGRVALPVWRAAADRQLGPCDAVLRLPGASKGADNDVRLARERGLPVDLSRFRAAPGTLICDLSFECDGAFQTQC